MPPLDQSGPLDLGSSGQPAGHTLVSNSLKQKVSAEALAAPGASPTHLFPPLRAKRKVLTGSKALVLRDSELSARVLADRDVESGIGPREVGAP